MKVSVLGIGNLLLGDEGVGVQAVNALRERYIFPENVSCIDGGTMGLDLLPFIEGSDKLLIIDAVDFKARPGTVRIIEGEDLGAFLDTKLSVHQIGLPDMLFAAVITGTLPPDLCLVGIQPGRIGTGLQMTEKIRENFNQLINAVLERLGKWGVEVNDGITGNLINKTVMVEEDNKW